MYKIQSRHVVYFERWTKRKTGRQFKMQGAFFSTPSSVSKRGVALRASHDVKSVSPSSLLLRLKTCYSRVSVRTINATLFEHLHTVVLIDPFALSTWLNLKLLSMNWWILCPLHPTLSYFSFHRLFQFTGQCRRPPINHQSVFILTRLKKNNINNFKCTQLSMWATQREDKRMESHMRVTLPWWWSQRTHRVILEEM